MLGAGFYHGVIDLAATDGSPIYAMQSGVVDSYVMGSDSTTGTLRIDRGIVDGKRLITSYGHMWNPLKYVKVGDKVSKSQIISDIGSSGIANGSHLHLAVKWGDNWVDRLEFFNDQSLDIAKNSSQITAKKTASFCDSYTSSEMGLKKMSKSYDYEKIALPKTTSTTKNVRYTSKSLQNIRSYPSVDNTKSGIVDTLKNGDFVTTTGRNIGDWYVMKYNDREVWVQKVAFMEVPKKVTSDTTSVVKGIDYTPKTKSNLYSYPSTSSLIYKEIVNVPNGSKLTGTGRALGNWTEVSHLGKTYWVTTAQLTGYEPPKLSTIQKDKVYSLRVNQNWMD